MGLIPVGLSLRKVMYKSQCFGMCVSGSVSLVTSIPVFLLFVMVISVLAVGKRENIFELEESLSNISNIEDIK